MADCTLEELIRIERKFKEDGWDALDHDERVCLEEFYTNVEPLIQHHEISHPEFVEGSQMWKAMPPEEREKYLEWKPPEIYAWKLLIDDFKEREEEALDAGPSLDPDEEALALMAGERKGNTAFALADLLSRRGLERPCETLVAWAREA
jgi:hypothetical protein